MYRAQMPPKEEPPKYLPRMAQVLPWELKGCSLKSLVDSLGKVRTHESKLCFVMFCHVLNVKKLGSQDRPSPLRRLPREAETVLCPGQQLGHHPAQILVYAWNFVVLY